MATYPDQINVASSPAPAYQHQQAQEKPPMQGMYAGAHDGSAPVQQQSVLGHPNQAIQQPQQVFQTQSPQQSYQQVPTQQTYQHQSPHQTYQHQSPQQSHQGQQAIVAQQPHQDYPAVQQPIDEKGAPQQPGYAQQQNQQFGSRAINDWKFSCMDVFSDMGICAWGCFLPCVLYGRTNARLKDPTLASHSDCNGACVAYCALCSIAACGCGPWQWILQMIQRGDIRRRQNIDGNGCEDCLLSYCCGCCTLIQEEKEMKEPLLMGSGQAVQQQQHQQGHQGQQQMGYQAHEQQAQGMQYKA